MLTWIVSRTKESGRKMEKVDSRIIEFYNLNNYSEEINEKLSSISSIFGEEELRSEKSIDKLIIDTFAHYGVNINLLQTVVRNGLSLDDVKNLKKNLDSYSPGVEPETILLDLIPEDDNSEGEFVEESVVSGDDVIDEEVMEEFASSRPHFNLDSKEILDIVDLSNFNLVRLESMCYEVTETAYNKPYAADMGLCKYISKMIEQFDNFSDGIITPSGRMSDGSRFSPNSFIKREANIVSFQTTASFIMSETPTMQGEGLSVVLLSIDEESDYLGEARMWRWSQTESRYVGVSSTELNESLLEVIRGEIPLEKFKILDSFDIVVD